MPVKTVAEELERIRRWPIEWQVELAEQLNSMTWREQWEAVCERIHMRAQAEPITDDEIDAVVREVRRDKPLHQR